MNIQFRLATDRDAASIAAFLAGRQGRRMTVGEWRWEFMRFPELSVFALAVHEGRLVGTQAMLPVHLNRDGKALLTSKSEASYVEPEYRGKGVFEGLYRFAEVECEKRGHVLIWGFTSAVRVWKESLNFGLVTPCIQELRLQLGAKYRLFNRFSRLSRGLWDALAAVGAIRQQHVLPGAIYEVKAALENEADMVALYEGVRKSHGIHFHLQMDTAYVNWRIRDNPNLKYTVEYLYQGQDLVGYYVYSMDGRIAKVSDITYKDSERAEVCLRALLVSVRKRGASSIYYFGNDDSGLNGTTFGTLEAWGGVKTRSSWANLVLKRNLVCDEEGLYDTSGWHLNGLWTEGITL